MKLAELSCVGSWSGNLVRRPLTTAFVIGLATASFARSGQVAPLKGSVLGTVAIGTNLGPVQDSEQVQFAVCMNIDTAGLQKFVDQVSNPKSPSYRQFITPEEVAHNFGASQQDIDSTVAFLQSNGLHVTGVGKTNMAIFVEGSAAQVQKAFGTSLVHVQREDGTAFRTNTTAVNVPAALTGKISFVYGLDTSRRMVRRANTTLLNPTLYRAAYDVAKDYSVNYRGQGRNIAIANWDGFRLNNLTDFYAAYGLPTPSKGIGGNVKVTVVGGGTGYGSGTPEGEGDLDMQNVLQSVPLCNLEVYDDSTSDTAAPLSTYDKIASDNTADIVTESYGWETYSYTYNRNTRKGTSTYYGAAATADHNEHLAIAAQGITYLAASGDSGAGSFTHVTSGTSSSAAYNYPDVDPEVLIVGGSVATVNSSTGAYVSETPWGLSGGVGGTGGFDTYDTPANGFAFNTAPSFQTSYISSFTSKYNYRLVPDVVSHAGGQNGLGGSSSGWAYTIFYNDPPSYPVGTEIYIDGTSCASPAVAGSLGTMISHLFYFTTPNSNRSNVRLGMIQPLLYSLGGTASVFNDITTGTGVGTVPGTSVAANPAVGWDLATGWGSLNFVGLYNALVTAGF